MTIPRLDFKTEKEARIFLESFLEPWFNLWPEVPCIVEEQTLRIDYVAVPKETVVDFPYPCFGIETKKSSFGDFKIYTTGLQQAIDYARGYVKGHRLPAVFVFPGICNEMGTMAAGANRLAGRFRVGTISQEIWHGFKFPRFEMCACRIWDVQRGAARVIPRLDKLGATERRAI
jgi:hypothetical protein